MVKKSSKKETIELAEEHIKIAEDLVSDVAKNSGEKAQSKLVRTQFELEKAEDDLDQLGEEDFDEEVGEE
jgi:hypothetical protein